MRDVLGGSSSGAIGGARRTSGVLRGGTRGCEAIGHPGPAVRTRPAERRPAGLAGVLVAATAPVAPFSAWRHVPRRPGGCQSARRGERDECEGRLVVVCVRACAGTMSVPPQPGQRFRSAAPHRAFVRGRARVARVATGAGGFVVRSPVVCRRARGVGHEHEPSSAAAEPNRRNDPRGVWGPRGTRATSRTLCTRGDSYLANVPA